MRSVRLSSRLTPGFDLSLGTIAPSLAGEDEAWKTPFAVYGPRGGFDALRAVLGRKEGVDPTGVTVTSGASMALTAALATLPKDRAVLIPRPYYPAYPNVAGFLGLHVISYAVTPGRPLAPAAEAAARKRPIGAIVVNTPGNPLGNLATRDDITALRTLAREAGAMLIVDETYAGIVLDPPPDAWSGAGAAPGVVRVKSLSKAYLLPGERVGYAVAEPDLSAAIEEAHWVIAMSPGITAQTNAARALLEDVPERLARLCARLRQSRDRAVEILADVPGLDVRPPRAGVFLWLTLPQAGVTGVDIAQRCRHDHGLAVMPGEACGQKDPPAIRVSFALDEGDATHAFRALGEALTDVGAGPHGRPPRHAP
jgi:arginine:pyruvate transaminase